MTRFPAKLLLFGEYSVLIGSSAMGMQYPRFGGELGMPGKAGPSEDEAESNLKLASMLTAFRERRTEVGEILDLAKLGRDIRKGLFFHSDIPLQYGLGSSGALCAALYEAYIRPGREESWNLPRLRQQFGILESVFHGTSSGFDPLLSHAGSALVLKNTGQIERADISWLFAPASGLTLFLLDSGTPCGTRTPVGSFMQNFSDHGPRSTEGALYSSLVNESIEFILGHNVIGLFERVRMIGAFQLTTLPELIPPGLHGLWRQGMETGLFSLKLCGSGGGGYIYCFTRRPEETVRILESTGLRRMIISSS